LFILQQKDPANQDLTLKKVASETEGNLTQLDADQLSSNSNRSSAEEVASKAKGKKGGKRGGARSQKKAAKYKKVKSLGNFCQ